MSEKYLKIETVAKMLDLNIWTIRKWVKERKIRTYRFGRAVRIREKDVLDFADVTLSIDELREKNCNLSE